MVDDNSEDLGRLRTVLRSTGEVYPDLFELAPIAYFILGARNQILEVNRAGTELLGVPRERLLGRPFSVHLEATESFRFHRHQQQVFHNPGTRHRIEVRLRRGDRTTAVVLIEAICIRSDGERFCRMAVVDVSERGAADRRLQEQQDRLQEILNTVVDGVVTIDDVGVIVSVNTGALRMFGFSEAQLLGQPIALLMPEAYRPRYRFLLRRYLDYGDDSIVGKTREVWAQRRDGTVFPVELTVGELRREHERQFVGVIRDTSERAHHETQLRESLTRFQEIAARIDDVFYIAEPSSGRVLYVSRAFQRIFGRPLPAETDGSWLPWIHDDDRDRVRAALGRAGGGRSELDEEYRIVRPDGTVRVVRDRAFPMYEENRITGIVHDVTEERQLEHEVRHAQRLEAVGTLASGIAHDFNNLLMGLGGLARQALRALPPDHPAAVFVQRGLQSTERGVALTRQLLMFSGQRRAQATPVELDAACRGAREMIERLVGEHIHVSLETGAPGLGVLAEPGEIEQILLNLSANSRDAMPGGGELVVRTAAAGDGGPSPRWVTVSVCDTGTGMNEETTARVFEPFFTTKGVGEGTGLGLSTVFAVVRQRGGDVRIESALGRGTTITIKLPVVAFDVQSAVPDGDTPRGSETVLAVEDDPLVRETIEGYLQALGYNTLMASHPDAAVKMAAREASVDLLLTDVMMPGRLGGDLARELKQAHPALRVLFMSAHPQSELLRLKRITTDDGLLCKPFGQHELGVAVRAALGHGAAPPVSGGQGDQSGHGALIVDDDPDVAETMRDALEQVGVSAAIAHSGSEAVQLAGTLHPDLVLCDVGLGRGMSGYDVARALRADARMRHATLVAITGLPSDQCGAAATAAGFDRVLTKPIDLPILEQLAKRLPAATDQGSR